MAHAIISSVAAVTAMRPAAVSPLLWFVLRCAGIFPPSIVLTVSSTGGHLCPPLVILGPRFGLLHRLKVPDCRKPFVLTCGGHPLVARSVRARCASRQPRNRWDCPHNPSGAAFDLGMDPGSMPWLRDPVWALSSAEGRKTAASPSASPAGLPLV